MPGYFDGVDPCWLRADNRPTGHRATLETPVLPGLVDELAARQVRVVSRRGDGNTPTIRFRSTDALPALTTPLTAPGSYALLRTGTDVSVVADSPVGLLYGWFDLLRVGVDALEATPRLEVPSVALRMLDHWDNLAAGPMGTVERGYAGDSLFFADNAVRQDLTRVRDYARLLASLGINAVCLNNVNVHARETRLLTDLLPGVARVAEVLRAYGVSTFLAVNFAAPIELGDLAVADPLDQDVRQWWRTTTDAVYAAIPDFGGYVVKADSENRPGPFSYGRSHADGANLLADALAPHGGRVLWRCFVYDCHQDWRDRSTDRARAAYDHFLPLDGTFADNVILQVKNGPIDFQVREPVSPLLGALPHTHLGLELQLTQEYTGQQRHICYLGGMWSEVLGFDFRDHDHPGTVADRLRADAGSAVVGVANVGTDPNWTGHALAQANLYAFGRLAWDPDLSPAAILDEWLRQTFADPAALQPLREFLLASREVYESYTAPLGVGFMVNPGHHYGPSVDGYEYSPWGTYHFADRDGVGVDRTAATGTGYTQQYPPERATEYEALDSCPDELLLFFHHVGYDHRLHSGRTVIQHIYDTHFDGVAAVEEFARLWPRLAAYVPPATAANITERLAEQVRSAREWRDQLTTYFWRHSGVPDEQGRRIY